MASRSLKAIQVVPSASRLVNSLRDLGYNFPQAVADLVDNSITAGADVISVELIFDGPDSWLRIADNGAGMSDAEITEAMRYGAKQSYGDEDLGKFGLGLKTASLSQCRRLTVASRRSSRARIAVRQLDLDHVIDSDRWQILVPSGNAVDQRLRDPLRSGSGTIVLWESLDRLLGYKIPWGKHAQRALDSLAEQLRVHIGMIFHRFIVGSIDGRRKVKILVNGQRVAPWDPFAASESATEVLPAADLDIEFDSGIGLVRFQPYVLPPRSLFSSEERFDTAGGPRRWNAQQGLYIYRANRLIQSGGWCRMRVQDEHLKLARASLDFFPDLDSAFEVNVSKVRVTLPADLRLHLAEPIDELARAAQSKYRSHTREPAVRSARINGKHRAALEKAAREAGEIQALRRIARRLRSAAPEVAKSLGW